ncbi:MAG: AAA family ATPase [Tannerellaceae bacterium]|jgi:exonuclease SbcC|nr:AAA family ATPase [Tannerellaceae bacterium]
MKILAIRGKNLASLEGEFELDFTSEPLKSAGIFAITGNTGSGKSTLLDALCLALFDNTPRMSLAVENNVAILDVKGKTINQKDCRTLLRRGTGEGYAEVDFLSAGGEKFRSTWLVKRARGRVDGSLLKTEMKLLNLSSGNELQGTKTELLAQIVERIGLTFDQFTRAVLLAQGDFATFLKAKQAEKAELLEKLTGTDIYSRISILIYEKTKNAEQEYLAVKERIQDVELLTDEEIEALHAERKQIEQQTVLLKTALNRLSAQIKWIDDRDALLKNVALAEKALADIQKRMAEARPRYDYIARIESVQDIRDRFHEWQHSAKQLEEKRAALKQKTAELDENAKALSQVHQAHLALEKEQEKLDREIAETEPEIIKARALDIQISGTKANVEEAEKEAKAAINSKGRTEKSIALLSKEMAAAQTAISKHTSWFEQHKVYKEIAPQTDLILTLLDDAKVAGEQSRANLKRQKENEQILETEKARLEKLKAESERLNKLLPAEIALLRAKLEEGSPCPVCGSLHHPAQSLSNEQSLQEKELNKAKEVVSKEISTLTDAIEKRKAETARLSALADNYTSQAAGALEKAGLYLSALPAWKADFEKGVLQTQIKETARQWKTYSEEVIQAGELINDRKIRLQSEQQNLAQAQTHLETKEKRREELRALLLDLQKQRKEILNGQAVDERSAYDSGRKKKMLETLSLSSERKNKLIAEQERLKGSISQISSETSSWDKGCSSLQKEINRWIESKQGSISREQLTELLSKDKQWLQQERNALNALKEQETTIKATLEERNKNLEKHAQAEIKADETCDAKDSLQETVAQTQAQIEQTAKRMAEIALALTTHEKGKERIKTFEKALAAKSVLAENWKKLNELFGSASGSKFKEIAQGYTLDALLTYANKQLKELSRRYELQRIPNTLALQVVDWDMLGEVRTVHSLSGGESFLISLALALGLSSLSSKRMRIESLFIDEGFGSLDIDTLRIAMDALGRLQTQGRKIGVISHVPEMTERIATQVCVIKTTNGRSSVKISGRQ